MGWRLTLWTVLGLCASIPQAKADFTGPSHARHAVSPGGNLIVRITSDNEPLKRGRNARHFAAYYNYDEKSDSYVRQTTFEVDFVSQMLFVSDDGDLVMIYLCEKSAICLYSKEGQLAKVWNLEDFLTKKEIRSCAETGSTLQWFDEGGFSKRTFHFRGPAQKVRALQAPFTVMRGANDKVQYSGSIDAATSKLVKDVRPTP